MSRWLASLSVVTVALSVTGCTADPPNPTWDRSLGLVRAEIAQVPLGLQCVELVAKIGSQTVTSDFAITPGSPATLEVPNLPVGPASFTASAFAATCPTTAGTQATWASAPTPVELLAGQIVPLSLTLEPVGGVSVGIHFGNDGGVDLAAPVDQAAPADLSHLPDMATECPCSGGKLCCGNRCVDPSDPANCGACGNVCASGACGTTISSDASQWVFAGTASPDPLQEPFVLTLPAAGQTGSAMYHNAFRAADFDARFDFRITLSPASGAAADGMGFMITQNFPGALGAGGGGLGMAGLTGFGVELDTYDNDTASTTTTPGCGDLNSDHTSIDSLSPPCIDQDGHVRPTALAGGTDLSTMLPPVQLADGNWHTCEVSMSMGSMSVLIDGIVRVTPTALPGFLSGTAYYFGFAGGTGGLFTRQEVRNPSISFPSVQCL